MGRIPRGMVIIEAFESKIENIILFLEKLVEKNYRELEVVVYPGYFYGRVLGSNSVNQYGVAPLSFIVPLKIVGGEHELIGKVYLVERDTWIDTKVFKIDTLLRIYNNVVQLIERHMPDKTYEEEINDHYLRFQCVDLNCDEILYMDGLNTQYNWVAPRKLYVSDLYRKALEDLCFRKPREYVLSYFISDNKINPLLVFKPGSPKSKIIYNLPRECSGLRKYLFWSLVDVLLI